MDTVSNNVVILARTKMNNHHVCVGGFDMVAKRYVRLLTRNAENQNEDSPYQVGEVYLVTYENRRHMFLPHCEDVCVQESTLNYVLTNDQLNQVLSEIAIRNIHIRDLFDGLLNWENSKAFLLENGTLPHCSVMIVSLDHDLFLSKKEYDGKQRFYYTDDTNNGVTFKVPYVGVGDIGNLKKIVAGSYVRFSLARWWDNEGRYHPRRAYLQLSAIY